MVPCACNIASKIGHAVDVPSGHVADAMGLIHGVQASTDTIAGSRSSSTARHRAAFGDMHQARHVCLMPGNAYVSMQVMHNVSCTMCH